MIILGDHHMFRGEQASTWPLSIYEDSAAEFLRCASASFSGASLPGLLLRSRSALLGQPPALDGTWIPALYSNIRAKVSDPKRLEALVPLLEEALPGVHDTDCTRK